MSFRHMKESILVRSADRSQNSSHLNLCLNLDWTFHRLILTRLLRLAYSTSVRVHPIQNILLTRVQPKRRLLQARVVAELFKP